MFYGLPCTKKYNTRDELLNGLAENLSHAPLNQPSRVVKQASGSSCSGIWVVTLLDFGEGVSKPETVKLSCQEMSDNHIEQLDLLSFVEKCHKNYLKDESYMIDQKFCPRIVEGEIRVLMGCDEVLEILVRLPAADSFSCASLTNSGKIYYEPDCPEFSKLVKEFQESLVELKKIIGMEGKMLPLLWSADFIRGEGADTYILGEMNCSCVGLTNSHVERGLPMKLAKRLRQLLAV